MNDAGITEVVAQLLELDPDSADRAELGAIVGLNARLRSFVDLVDVRCTRRANRLAAEGSSESGFSVLLSEGAGSGRDAKHAEDRDRVCDALPEFETALATGAVSGEHLDVLARATKDLTDEERCELAADADELVASASADSASLFARTLKSRVAEIKARTRANSDVDELERQRAASNIKQWTDQATGLKMTLLALDPLRNETFHAAVAAQLAQLRQDPANAQVPFAQLQVNAVLAAVSDTAGEFAVPEIVLHTDTRTMCQGRHADTLCETVDGVPVPVATMHRLCCEAVITTVIIDADGTARRLSEERTANRHQRQALAAMYSACAHPHCAVPFSACRMHHIVWYSRGGKTVLANLLPLCEAHHHLVHEGGWNLTITTDRTLTWHRPDGTVWLTHHSPNRRQGSQADRHHRPPDTTATRLADEPTRQPTLC